VTTVFMFSSSIPQLIEYCPAARRIAANGATDCRATA
jgi:hypothetical protein